MDLTRSEISRHDEERLEHQHYLEVLSHFQQYARHTARTLAKHAGDYAGLPAADRALLPAYAAKLELVRGCAQQNQCVLFDMIQSHVDQLEDTDAADDAGPAKGAFLTRERAQENIRSLLRQLARDWSAEGAAERACAYAPILQILARRFPSAAGRRVLVPGAGLGRLVYEICQLGFDCQGNEFSLFMLLPSEWILNSRLAREAVAVHPWILPFSNHRSAADQARAVRVPDVVPGCTGGRMSMTAGDFLQVYAEDAYATYDSVVTCFFLDTAKNVVEYVRRIHALLRAGGTWVNHGPLLYHFEGSAECSIELSLEEVRDLIRAVGFTLDDEQTTECPYTQDGRSMHATTYRCALLTMTKPAV